MNNHVQCGTNQKDEYPESKTVSRINLITSEQSKILIVWLRIDQQVVIREDDISLKVLYSLQRLMLGC